MTCPNCGEKPNTYLQAMFPGKEGFKKALKGRFTCRHCGTELTFQKNEYGLQAFKPKFYIILAVFGISTVFLAWAFIYNLDQIFADISPLFAIAVLFVSSLAIGLVGGVLARKYALVEAYKEEEENREQDGLSAMGMVLFFVYAILAIFGFGFFSAYADEHSFNTAIYLGGTLIYLALAIGIALWMMKLPALKKSE